MKQGIATFAIVLLLSWGGITEVSATSTQEQIFLRSPTIDTQIRFWKKIYAQFPTSEGVFHDSKTMFPIYGKLNVEGLGPKARNKKIRKYKRKLERDLRGLANALKQGQPLTTRQKGLLKLFPANITPRLLQRAALRVRFQGGIADRFRDGVVRSGAYLNYIHRVLKQHGVPKALAYLPHVESSFIISSHSHAGAQGIWQFIRSTGKRYMTINAYVDERRDPYIATVAAAKLLRSNYDKLESWPLAITAYNHGVSGMKRMVRKMKTKDLGYLIDHYHSRTFRFASKNFYAEFLAAWEVAENYQKYFGELSLDKPRPLYTIQMDRPLYFHSIASALKIPEAQLHQDNPALQRLVLQGALPVPKTYTLKIEPKKKTPSKVRTPDQIRKVLASISSQQNRPKVGHVIVRRGDTLSKIAQRVGTSTRRLAAYNGISVRSTIYPGQKLYFSHGRSAGKASYTSATSKRKPVRPKVVTVKRGDSLSKIAQRNGVALRDLIAANGLSRNAIIYPGQKLKLRPDDTTL